jgi:hypothetical protein
MKKSDSFGNLQLEYIFFFFLSLISTNIFLIVEEPPLEEGFREIPHCGAGEPMSEPCQAALCSSGAEHLLSVPLPSRTSVSRREEEVIYSA